MTDGRETPISGPADSQTLIWLGAEYLRYLTAQITLNVTYLNQSITWSVGIVTAVVAVVITQPLPNLYSFAAVLVAALLVTHFMVRGIRGYINVMRFSILSRALIAARIGGVGADLWRLELIPALVRRIQVYDCEWTCPLKPSTVAYKMIFELGFGLFYVILAGAAITSSLGEAFPSWGPLVAGFGVALAVELFFGTIASAYFRKIEPDDVAQQLR